jgi:glycosyltransferase involved in cell wall biosynthesis
VVHVATEFAMGLAGLKAAERLGIPVISSAHTDYQKYAYRYGVPWVLDIGWIYGRWFYNRTARVLCPSRLYEEYLHTRGILHTGVWTRGVDPEEFNPAFRSESYRQSFGVGPDDLLVTYIGRLAKEKDLGRLLDAWRSLGNRKGTARLVLVGKGPMGDDLERHPVAGVHLRSSAWPRSGRGLCLRRSLRVPFLHRNVRQLAPRSDGIRSSLPRRRGWRSPRVRPAREKMPCW